MTTVSCLVAACLLADPAVARTDSPGLQPTLPPTVEVTEVDSVTLTARAEARDSFDQAAAMSVLDAEQIRRQSPAVMPDLLRDQPGVFVQQTGPGQGAPIVRGLIGSAVLTLVDGVRLNNGFFRPSPNQFFALVDPYNIDRIEIVRGAGSSLHGSDAMGGTVRVFTPTPSFRGSHWQVGGRALGQIASGDRAAVSRLALAGGREGLSLSGGFTYQRHGDLRRGGGDVQRPSAFSAYAADSKLALERGGHRLLFGAQLVSEPETPRYDELVPGFGRDMAPAEEFVFAPMRRLLTHTQYRYRSDAPAVRLLEARLSFQRIDDDRRVRDLGSTVQVRERNQGDSFGAGVETVATPALSHTLTYGFELYQDRIYSSRVDFDGTTGMGSIALARYPDGSRINSFGVYLQDHWRALSRLVLTPGVRFSLFDVAVTRADREVGADLRETAWTGGLGALFSLTPTVNLAANVGRGFRMPNVFDLSTLGNRPGNRFQVPNADLAPESILTGDLGLKLDLAAVTGEVFVFHSRYRDKIEAAPTGELTPDGRQIVRSANVNRVDLLGSEAMLRVVPSSRLVVAGSVTYVHGRETTASITMPADRIPPLHGRLGVAARVWRSLWVEGFARGAARQSRLSDRDRTDSRIDPRGTPGWVTMNLRLWGALAPGISARLACENLLDARYREHGSGIDATGFNATAALELAL
jgi:hemoglobin/transferrin/lactoferrin receptor protein